MPEFYPGDSGPIYEVGYEGADGKLVPLDNSFQCKLVVVKEGQSAKTIDKAIADKTQDGLRFVIRLTEQETNDLGPGVHSAAVFIINNAAQIKRRKQFTINLRGDGLPQPT